MNIKKQSYKETLIKRKYKHEHRLLGVKITSITEERLLNFVQFSLKNKTKFFITTPNPEIMLLAQNDKTLKDAINNSDIALPDGVGIVLASKYKKINNINRIPGRAFMVKLLEQSNTKSHKIFILGSSQSVIQKSLKIIQNKYPNIDAQGDWGFLLDNNAMPATKRDIALEKDILDRINKFQPDILFIAFGAPKQEKWLFKHFDNLKIGGAMVVGGGIDYFSGKYKLPPKLFSRYGLEWLWRLYTSPKRLNRIINATIRFPLLVILKA